MVCITYLCLLFNLKILFMLGENIKQQDFESRKEYLLYLAIAYIKNHTGFVGMDDDVFFDEAECDGYALVDDLMTEFDLDDKILESIV